MNSLLERTTKNALQKTLTGIQGLDEITDGGLPKGRPTLVCGGPGCGKSLLAMEFIVRGAFQFHEPGVFVSFEETENELVTNVSSMGFDLETMVADKKIVLDHIHVDRSEIEESGGYDLEGLFIRLNHAIESIGAKRVVLDTIEILFAGFPNHLIIRNELQRLFRWLKAKGQTVIITGERGEGTFTRYGLEEYVSDCVIMLDHRIYNQNSVRRLRIVKYRGSIHGTNEYPFLIGTTGFSVMPVTSVGLNHHVSSERISSGITILDQMLEIKGFFKGSSILVSGTAGTGKTSLAAHFANAACQKNEKVLFFAFEESPNQIIRNMLSIGIDLEQWTKKNLLQIYSMRPTLYGLEMQLSILQLEITRFNPAIVIVDPLNSVFTGNTEVDARWMAMRLIDFLKNHGITSFLTDLTVGGQDPEHTNIFISSIIDTWLLIRDFEIDRERRRSIFILKSRGMAHSRKIKEFKITSLGITILE